MNEWGIDDKTKRARVGQCVEDLLAKQATRAQQQANKDFEPVITKAIATAQAANNAAWDLRVSKLMESMKETQADHMAQVDVKLNTWKQELEQSVKSVQDDLNDFKKVSAADAQAIRGMRSVAPPIASPARRSGSVGARNSFVPSKVFVQGFYDFSKGQGALKADERDALAKSLLDRIPQDVKEQFTLETRYSLTRRLVFVTKNGGEICWILREKLADRHHSV